jgi:hypothetical protein
MTHRGMLDFGKSINKNNKKNLGWEGMKKEL